MAYRLDWLTLVLGAVLGALVAMLFNAFHVRITHSLFLRRPSAALLKVSRTSAPLIYIGVPVHVRARTRAVRPSGLPVFGYGPLMALANLSRLLTASGVSRHHLPTIKPSTAWDVGDLDKDLLVLGWPRGNDVAATLMGMIDVPVEWRGDDGRAVWGETPAGPTLLGRGEYEESGGDRRTVRDFGVAISVANPRRADRAALLLGGSETFGVLAAAEAISPENVPAILNMGWIGTTAWNLPIVRSLLVRRLRNREWCFVVDSDVRDLSITPPRFVYTWTRKVGTEVWLGKDRRHTSS